MSNVLKVTTPITGYDNALNKQTTAQKPEDMSIKNQVDTQRVVRADGRETGAEQGVRREISYASNFGSFLESLQNVPKLREIMTKLLYSNMGTLVEAGISKGTASDIQSLLEMLKMDPEQLQAFLKSQMGSANRMQGSLFDLLRQVMGQTRTVELKAGILDFLKKYNDLSSGQHLMKNIRGNLSGIQSYMFRNDRDALQQLIDKLLPHSIANNGRNAQILKEQIIPFIGRYVAETKDMGPLRDMVSLLTLNTSRYENGSLDRVVQSFQRLMDFPAFQKTFAGVTADQLRQMLMNVDFERAAGKMEWSDKMLSIMQASIRGEAGVENREAFMNIMNSMLVNESVYMPVTHIMLPVILNGVPMFSEIWVDPDEESGNPDSAERGVKLLIKFDLKDIGFFDMMLYYEKGKVDMMLHCPKELAGQKDSIRGGLREILTRNNLEVEYLAVEEGKQSIPVSAAFPKIFERRNSVNVSV